MMRLLARLFSLLSIIFAAIVSILWVKSYLESSNGTEGIEVSRWAMDYDLRAGGKAWSDHLGSYRSGVYWVHDVMSLDPGHDNYVQKNGRCEWYHGTQTITAQQIMARLAFMRLIPAHSLDPEWSSLGFQAFRFEFKNEEYGSAIVVPDWFLMVATLAGPIVLLRKWIRAKGRIAKGRCAHCGYDVRANNDCCPECGTPIRKNKPI